MSTEDPIQADGREHSPRRGKSLSLLAMKYMKYLHCLYFGRDFALYHLQTAVTALNLSEMTCVLCLLNSTKQIPESLPKGRKISIKNQRAEAVTVLPGPDGPFRLETLVSRHRWHVGAD